MTNSAPPLAAPIGRAQQTEITFAQALRVYARIALWSFGGPAGQIAVMHRVLVEEKRWLSEERFLHGLNFCMLLPGPEAQQLVTYVGWLLHGVRGGLAAGWLFVLPGFLSILLLSVAYVAWQQTVGLAALGYGLKAAVLALVVEALLRIARRALRRRWHWFLAGASFCAIYFLHVPYPLIIVSAAVLGWLGERWLPPVASGAAPVAAADAPSAAQTAAAPILDRIVIGAARPNLLRTLATAGLWAVLWLGPVGLLWALLGGDHRLTQIGAFFSQTAAVTFGGAYSVLAYVQQHAVHDLHWLSAAEMLDGLGMAETTPGPLIQVLQFVGFLAGYRTPGAANPWATALGASVLTTWVTFAPSFLWIFTGAPYLELLRKSQPVKAALTGITAAVVGVVLNLTVTFVLQVLFGEVTTHVWHGWHYPHFAWSQIDLLAAGLAALGLVGALRWKWNMFLTLGLPTALGCAAYLLRQ